MGTLKVDDVTDAAGTGAPDFPNGLTQGGGEPVGGGGSDWEYKTAAFTAEFGKKYIVYQGGITVTMPLADHNVDSGKVIEIVTISYNTTLALNGSNGHAAGPSPQAGAAASLDFSDDPADSVHGPWWGRWTPVNGGGPTNWHMFAGMFTAEAP